MECREDKFTKIGNEFILHIEKFQFLGTNREAHRGQLGGCDKCRQASGVLCNQKVPLCFSLKKKVPLC